MAINMVGVLLGNKVSAIVTVCIGGMVGVSDLLGIDCGLMRNTTSRATPISMMIGTAIYNPIGSLIRFDNPSNRERFLGTRSHGHGDDHRKQGTAKGAPRQSA